jgi:anti-anti-sigma regulatory factor
VRSTCIPELRITLNDALRASDDVRLDLTEVRFLDSIAIRELLRAQALAARAGKGFGIVSAAPAVRHSLMAGRERSAPRRVRLSWGARPS